MKLKALIFMGSIFLATAPGAQAIEFTKTEVMNIVVPTAIEATCTPAFLECLELSDYTCEDEVIKSAQRNCSSLVPDIMNDISQITSVAGQVGTCIAQDVISLRRDVLAKNANTPACQQLAN